MSSASNGKNIDYIPPSTTLAKLKAELLFLFLVVCVTTSTVYDFSAEYDNLISILVNKLIYEIPVITFLFGFLVGLFTWLISNLWLIKWRYVLALLILGFVLGHLFWALPQP